MVRTVITMVAREGCERALEDAWKAFVKQTGVPPGNLGQALTRDSQDRRTYIITGDWENRDALRSFETSAERKALSAALEPLRERSAKAVLDIVARA